MTNPISFIESCTQELYLEDTRQLSKFSQDSYKAMTTFNEAFIDDFRDMKTAFNKKIAVISFDYHRTTILRSHSTYDSTRMNLGMTTKFFKNIDFMNIDQTYKIYDLDYSVVQSIRPGFLSDFAKDIRRRVFHDEDVAVASYLKGSLDRLKLMDITSKVKSNCVKCIKDIDLNQVNDIFGKYDRHQSVDENTIKQIVSYLEDEPSKYRSLVNLIEDTVKALNDAEKTIMTLTPIIVTGKIDNVTNIDDRRRKFAYSGIKALAEVSSYLTYGIITLITIYSKKLLSITRLRDLSMSKVSSTSTIIEESGNNGVISATDTEKLADDIKNGHVDAYTELSRNLYQFNKSVFDHYTNNGKGNSVSTLATVNRSEYNNKVYKEAVKIYIMVLNGLNILSKKSDEYIDVFDHLIETAGFQLRLEDKYRGILETLDDITEYESSSSIAGDGTTNLEMYLSLINELDDYSDNMQTIADTAFDVYQTLKSLKKRFNDNINGEYRQTEAINQLNIFFEDLEDQYKNITNIIASKFLLRLTSMGYCAEKFADAINENTSGITIPREDKPEDFRSTIFESELEQISIADASISRYMQECYIAERIRRDRGCREIVLEAEQPASTTTGTGGTTSGDKKQDSSSTPSTQAKVIDNSADANAAKQVDSKSSKFSQEMVTKICETVKRWFENAKTSFKNIMDRKFLKEGFVTGPDGKKLSYTNFLRTYKEYLIGKNYTNTEIHILPYKSIEDIYKGMNSLKTNVSALNKEGIKAVKSEQEMYMKLFSFVTGLKSGEIGSMKTQITNYMTTGADKPEDRVYKNNEVSEWVKSTIPFLEQFMGTHLNRINQEISSLDTSLENVTKTYVESFEEIFTDIDSLYTEADAAQGTDVSGQQQHTQSVTSTGVQANNSEDTIGIQAKSGWMRTAVMYFTGTICNIVRDRVQNSFKILAGFSDKANKALAQKNQDGTNPKTENVEPTNDKK